MQSRRQSLNPCSHSPRFTQSPGASPGAVPWTARMVVAVMIAVVLSAFSVSGQLLVDFSQTGVTPEAGFESYEATHENSATFITRSYTAFGATVSLTPDWPNTTDNRVRQMIDRGSGNDAQWLGTQIDLVTDWIGIDTRTGNGGNGNYDGTTGTPTYMTLTLGGLPAGIYDWTSYHHDTENCWPGYRVDISVDGGATFGDYIEGQMTDSSTGGNPDSGALRQPGSAGLDPIDLPSTFKTTFAADGASDVVVRFVVLSDTAVHRQIFGVNGFRLEVGTGLPIISPQPQSQDLILGEPATLTAGYGSIFPATLQWRLNGAAIPGETNATLQISSAAVADAGDYDLVVTSSAGSVTSDTAVVTVGLPEIDPTAQVVLATFPATFIITMPTNFPSYTYAWTGPTGLISGATSPTLTVVNVTTADTGTYTVDVTAGSDTLSASAELTVPTPPTDSYANLVTTASPVVWWRLGEAAGSTVAVDEMGALNGDILSNATLGATGAILGDPDTAMEFPGIAKVEADPYLVLPTTAFTVEFWALSSGGSGFRSPVSMREDGVSGERYGWTFYATTDNTWRFDSYDGMESPWNSIVGPPVVQGQWAHVVGTYDGTDVSFFVNGTLAGTVTNAPYLYTDLIPLWIGAGGPGGYGEDGSFHWVGKVDEVAVYDRALSSTEVLDHYTAAFDVTAPPAIASQPLSQSVLIGNQAVFQVEVVSGTLPTYQWRMDGVDIPGATSDTLVLDPVVVTDAGDYDVVVSNAAGSTPSDAATLVPLVDYLGTLVLPDGTNTVLTRDGSSDWFSVESDTDGKWNRREVFGIQPGLTPWGFQGTAAREAGGDLEVRTTLTGLQPNTDYAVWTLYSTKGNSDGTITGQAIRSALSGFDGEGTTEFSPSDETYTGVYAADFWWVYQAYLGVRTSDGAGTIAVLFDYAPSGERTMYQGVGYQEAVPTVIPPVISIPPASQAVLIGSNATFSVSAGSLVPMTYQWQFDGADLPGETNDTLTITSVQRADGGTYQVVVSNSEGSVTSDPADLVTLIDYVGTFVFPDSSNTVLTRDGSSDWFATSQADAESNAQWTARADLSVPAIPDATNGYYAAAANEGAGDIEVRTTVSGLDPTKSYAVWALYSYPPGDTGSRLAVGFEGENLTTWDDINGQDTGLPNSLAGYDVYQGLLGVRTPDGSGNLQVLVDYRGGVRSIYTGLGYQLAVLPPDIEMDISLDGGVVTVSWPDGSGALQESEDLTNPAAWVDVPGATPPHMDPGTVPQKAFRLRE